MGNSQLAAAAPTTSGICRLQAATLEHVVDVFGRPAWMAQTADESFRLALRHLERVRGSWDPPDWAELSFYGFYCLEACIVAALYTSDGRDPRRTGARRRRLVV